MEGGYLTPAPASQVELPTGQVQGSPEAVVAARQLTDVEIRQTRVRIQRSSLLANSATADELAALQEEVDQLELQKIELGAVFNSLVPEGELRSELWSRAFAHNLADPEARAALASVRRNLNEYRDGKRDSLVHARNDLLRLFTIAGVMAYVLLGVAVVMGVEHEFIAAATVFFVVGALFGGVVNELNSRVDKVKDVEDFKLSEARLLLTPFLSGLAAIGGVAATAIGAEILTAAMDGSGTADSAANLSETFDPSRPERFAVGIVVAAIFGLSPTRLITRLNNSADEAKIDLKNSSATSAKA